MTVFYTSDPHYFHESVIVKSKRPFDNLQQMHECLIDNHNSRVRTSDDVYILGDFALHKDIEQIMTVYRKLNGRKHLIRGNHDKRPVLQLNWSSKPEHKRVIKDEGRVIVLSHYAERSWDKMYRGSYHFFGHTHGKLQGAGRSIDVGVDTWDFKPVTACEAIERMKVWNKDFDTYAPECLEIYNGDEIEDDYRLTMKPVM